MSLNGVSVGIFDDAIKTAIVSVGEAAVFVGCAKLAQVIILKNKSLSAFNKIGIAISSGSGGYIAYKVINKSFDILGFEKNLVILNGTLSLDSLTISSTANYFLKEHPVLSYMFGMHKDISFNNLNQQF